MTRMTFGAVRMALAVVAVLAALAVRPAIGLGPVTLTALRAFGLLGCGLEPLQSRGRLDEILR